MLKSLTISETLVKNGKADVNGYNADGCTLLIDAIKRGDGFSAQFLLDKKCKVNLTARNTGDTAMHLICTYSESTSDTIIYTSMMSICEQLLVMDVDVNQQNIQG